MGWRLRAQAPEGHCHHSCTCVTSGRFLITSLYLFLHLENGEDNHSIYPGFLLTQVKHSEQCLSQAMFTVVIIISIINSNSVVSLDSGESDHHSLLAV